MSNDLARLDIPRAAAVIRMERHRRGWSQTELGARCLPPVTRGTVGLWERGEVNDPTSMVRALIALDQDPYDFAVAPPAALTQRRRLADLTDVQLADRVRTLFSASMHEVTALSEEIGARLGQRPASLVPPPPGTPGVIDAYGDEASAR